MKIIGQFFIAIIGGIVAILIYRLVEKDGACNGGGQTHSAYSHAVAFNSTSADSLNNVFNVGFLDLSQGVVVANLVRNGPADKAGLRVKDVILQVDGESIQNTSRLLEIVAGHKPGDKLEVVIQRGKQKETVPVRLQDAKKIQSQKPL
jgi:S1-C subfamily serine protease